MAPFLICFPVESSPTLFSGRALSHPVQPLVFHHLNATLLLAEHYHGVGYLAGVDGAPSAQLANQQGAQQRIERLEALLRQARRLAVAEQHGGAHYGEPWPGLCQQRQFHLPLGAGIEGRRVWIGPQTRDDDKTLAAVAASECREGQHIVVIDPVKRLVGPCLLAGGAEAAEGDVDRIGQAELRQLFEVDRQPVMLGSGITRLATEQGQ